MAVVINMHDFCHFCGAHIPPRYGEGTCHKCDYRVAIRETKRMAGMNSEELLVENFTIELFLMHDKLHKMLMTEYQEAVRDLLKKHNLAF